MNMADDYVSRAGDVLRQARQSFEMANWPLAISRSEETIELSLKAILRSLGESYKREHDISAELMRPEVYRLLPAWFQENVARFRMISTIMFQLRQLARYGEETLQVPASRIFTRDEASVYVHDAEEVYLACRRLIGEIRTK